MKKLPLFYHITKKRKVVSFEFRIVDSRSEKEEKKGG